jgi:hypothetical protein
MINRYLSVGPIRFHSHDRLLDPTGGSVTLETPMSAAKAVGREPRLEFH